MSCSFVGIQAGWMHQQTHHIASFSVLALAIPQLSHLVFFELQLKLCIPVNFCSKQLSQGYNMTTLLKIYTIPPHKILTPNLLDSLWSISILEGPETRNINKKPMLVFLSFRCSIQNWYTMVLFYSCGQRLLGQVWYLSELIIVGYTSHTFRIRRYLKVVNFFDPNE